MSGATLAPLMCWMATICTLASTVDVLDGELGAALGANGNSGGDGGGDGKASESSSHASSS